MYKKGQVLNCELAEPGVAHLQLESTTGKFTIQDLTPLFDNHQYYT